MAMKNISLQEALDNYKREQDHKHIQEGNEERIKFQEKFPIESWQDMTLGDYALGQPDFPENVCWYAEFGTPHLGSIKGGSARKHLVFKYKNKPGWYFPTGYKDHNEAWQTIRSGFIQMFELAENGQWDQIEQIESIRNAQMLRAKLLNLYFPEQILPITSTGHMKHYLKQLGNLHPEMAEWDVIQLNRILLETLLNIKELQEWTPDELGMLLYFWTDPRESRKIYKIAPGTGAEFWEDCLNNGYICVGWDDIGNLREFDSLEEFEPRFAEVFAEKHNHHLPTLTKKARELWTLITLAAGDLIIANKGTSEILAVGEVLEPGYEFYSERQRYKHTVHVKWDTSFAKQIPPQKRWALVTIAPVGTEFYNQVITGGEVIKTTTPAQVVDPLFIEIADALERKGQVILYGPPGTGKTYQARRFSEWWLDKKNEDTEEIKKVTRRVWWAVASPKQWSWDQLFEDKTVEFDYGRLQRNFPQVKPGDLVIGYQANPDKRIMALAEVTKGIGDFSADNPQIELKPLEKITNGPTYQEMIEDPNLKNSEPLRNRCQGRLFALTPDEAQYLFYVMTENGHDVTDYLSSSEIEISSQTFITFHPSYNYEDFIEGYRPVETSGEGLVLRLEDGIFKRICREAITHPNRTYLLIIDEINRANVSKVLGELITLLEKDKRDQIVVLPQSKENFLIPLNVYLLGTMNTADRSIKLLDTALRRRFAFIEMMPDLELLRGATVNNLPLDDFLQVINSRVSSREGREKQIGHAYLFDDGQPISDPSEFVRRFRQEILPLLQEYCYEDYITLAEYLGNKLVDSENQVLNFDLLVEEDALIDELVNQVEAEGN